MLKNCRTGQSLSEAKGDPVSISQNIREHGLPENEAASPRMANIQNFLSLLRHSSAALKRCGDGPSPSSAFGNINQVLTVRNSIPNIQNIFSFLQLLPKVWVSVAERSFEETWSVGVCQIRVSLKKTIRFGLVLIFK